MDIDCDIVSDGLANKVADTYQNMTNTTDVDKTVASGLSLVVSLTGKQGIGLVVGTLKSDVNKTADNLMNTADNLIDNVIELILDLANNSQVINALLDGIGKTSDIIGLAKKGLLVALSQSTVITNIAELAAGLCGIASPDSTIIPTVKESTKILGASMKDLIMCKYQDAKTQVLDLYNAMICTSNDSTMDNAILSINNILDVVGPTIEPMLLLYTGYTVSEVKYTCNDGLKMLDEVLRTLKKERNGDSDNTSDESDEEDD